MTNCKKGEIKRASYKRRSYSKKDGTKVKAARVSSACMQDRGQPGKGPKILPPIDKNVSLSRHGYNLKKTSKGRQAALKRASKEMSTLAVLRRTNLIRNYSKWNPENYKKLSSDVEYMKREYAKIKKNSKINR